ncbi:TetR/AcrR family transcriptional regulator [Xylanimonas allomyrinae]|uniref:TetR/AcrR family transcriptional regulator n=1 Tax=Xylanimonas allomyrinae TaxID=2509459 RepID=A0A4P6EL82_9MICO|nr:TetR/AcrR family transcriptional regulator [Xylanimonas allomyrinae]QAY62433.1 TetR/AcrR family transcriptional regulator [Xylanimonas allomyrinae]
MTVEQDAGRRRATPLSPDERRAAIVEAALPIVAEHGLDVTTRELAAAAGVAEGTLFRVFPDKNTLVGEVAITGLLRASEPATTRDDLASVDRDLPLVERVTRIIELGQERMGEAAQWMTVLHTLRGRVGDSVPRTPEDEARIAELRGRLMAQHELHRAVIAEGLRTALAPDLDRLRVPVDVAASLIEAAVVHRRAGPNRLTPPLSADVLADAVVHGIVSDEPRDHARAGAP